MYYVNFIMYYVKNKHSKLDDPVYHMCNAFNTHSIIHLFNYLWSRILYRIIEVLLYKKFEKYINA